MTASPPIQLLEELGRGSTAVVWRAVLSEEFRGLPAGSEVACKRYFPTEAARKCQAREARIGGSVQAEGLIRLYGSGEDSEGPWLLMELLPGRNLEEVLSEEHALAEPLVRSIGKQLSGALAGLHAEGISHGDLKPENARLDQDGRSVLVDLGFADDVEASGEERRGTPLYLSPELIRGAPISAASDVFALGVVLYQLVTGTHPFVSDGAEDTAQVFQAITNKAAPIASEHAPTVSAFLDHLLAELLQADSTKRPTAEQLRLRLKEGERGSWWREETGRGEWGAGSRPEHFSIFGREESLRSLHSSWASLPAGGGGVITIDAPTGSGKSRLIRAFTDSLRLEDPTLIALLTEPVAVNEARPCLPFLRLLRRSLRLPPGAQQGERETSELSRYLSPSSTETLLQTLDPDFDGITPSAVPLALSEWITALSTERRVIIFLDDAHLADEGSLTVAHRILEELEHTPILLIIGLDSTRRPHRAAPLERLIARAKTCKPYVDLPLPPLDQDAVLALVRELFVPSAPRLRLSRVLWERSRGNPGFLTELIRGLERKGSISRALPGAPYELHVSPDAIPLPDSLPNAIIESYRELSPYDRRWLQRLSVCGGRIRQAFLRHTWPEASGPDLPEVLSRLVNAGWLIPAGHRLCFRRPALREAVYGSLSEARRLELHSAISKALADPLESTQSLSAAFQLAWHLRASQRWDELLQHLPALLESLGRRGQPQRVRSLCDWGIEALDALPPSTEKNKERLHLLELRADASDQLGDRKRQRADLDALSELIDDPDEEPSTTGRIYLLHARHAAATGSSGIARGLLRNSIAFLKRTNLAAPLSDARRRLAEVHAQAGDLGRARRSARKALLVAPNDLLRGQAQVVLGTLDVFEDMPESALRRADRAVRLFRRSAELDTNSGLGAADLLRARAYRNGGRPRRALASAQRAVRHARRAADRCLEAEALARLGASHLDLDSPDEAELPLREAVLLSKEIEFQRGEVIALAHLGILAAEDERADASQLIDSATKLARGAGLHRIEAIGLAIRARIDQINGDSHRAADGLERALWLLERYGAELLDRIVILSTRVMILNALGQPERARAVVKALRRKMRKENEQIEGATLRRRHRLATTRLLEYALSPEGPVFPRSAKLPNE